jgi:hypothetical protein
LPHAGRERTVDQDAVAFHLQLGQAARRGLNGQGLCADGQHHAVRRQQLQYGRCQGRRGIQQHDAIEGRHRVQQVGRAEHGLQGALVDAALGHAHQQRHPLVLRVGNGADLNQRERGSGH